MTILSIGKCRYDITCLVDNFNLSNKVKLNEGIRCGGGSASNVAFLLGKWGLESVVAANVGADSFAEDIKKELTEARVNTNFLETNYEQGTSINLMLLNNTDKSLVSYETSFEYKPLKKYNYDFTPDIIFTDAYDYGATQNAISKYTKAISILDARAVNNETIELSKYAKYIIASIDFASSITGLKIDMNNSQTLVDLFSKFMNKYPNSEVIITLGSNGALYKSNNEIKIMPGINVEVQDLNGCKDAFNGAFIYGLANGYDIERSITLANIAAGLSARSVGARTSFPSLSEAMDFFNKKYGSQQAPVQEATPQVAEVAPTAQVETPVVEQAPAPETASQSPDVAASAPSEVQNVEQAPVQTEAPAVDAAVQDTPAQ